MTEGEKINAAGGADVSDLVQMVLREAYLEATEDLRAYAEKVRYLNRQKKALRALSGS